MVARDRINHQTMGQIIFKLLHFLWWVSFFSFMDFADWLLFGRASNTREIDVWNFELGNVSALFISEDTFLIVEYFGMFLFSIILIDHDKSSFDLEDFPGEI